MGQFSRNFKSTAKSTVKNIFQEIRGKFWEYVRFLRTIKMIIINLVACTKIVAKKTQFFTRFGATRLMKNPIFRESEQETLPGRKEKRKEEKRKEADEGEEEKKKKREGNKKIGKMGKEDRKREEKGKKRKEK